VPLLVCLLEFLHRKRLRIWMMNAIGEEKSSIAGKEDIMLLLCVEEKG
jgi:hypothetical protein